MKLAVFARLFAARTDVYARYWENPRKGTKGWLPVVRDPFRKGSLWDRRPLPLTTGVLAAHLRSDDDLFIGLYPLLPDATCWWLAADFDGPQAMLDAHAYVKAATSLGVPCGLEISQSGRGAHVWTFFTSRVPAADARAVGTACIHRAMALRGSMPLTSYDRLFPNQDTVPTGSSGVGNLIAAPLNGRRRVGAVARPVGVPLTLGPDDAPPGGSGWPQGPRRRRARGDEPENLACHRYSPEHASPDSGNPGGEADDP